MNNHKNQLVYCKVNIPIPWIPLGTPIRGVVYLTAAPLAAGLQVPTAVAWP